MGEEFVALTADTSAQPHREPMRPPRKPVSTGIVNDDAIAATRTIHSLDYN
jgi:hypothetical protein